MAKTFPILYEEDENGYFIAVCPLFEGCYTQGKTLQEATENIKEVIELCLEGLNEDEIPNREILFGQVVILWSFPFISRFICIVFYITTMPKEILLTFYQVLF